MKTKQTSDGAVTASHEASEDGDAHTVCINALRVIVSREDEAWIAQGIEIDYFAYGDTAEEAKRRFGHGLAQTIAMYIEHTGSIDGLLKFAPRSERAQLSRIPDAERCRVDIEALVQLERAPEDFPYRNLAYVFPAEGVRLAG